MKTLFASTVAGLLALAGVAAAIDPGFAPGVTTRVSVSSSGVPANGAVSSAVLAANGRYVVFMSMATNLGAIGVHVYRHDRMTGATELVSVAVGGSPSTGTSLAPTVSADGRYVAFASTATDLVADDTNNAMDVFVRDMQAGTTALVSASSSGAAGNLNSGLSGLSGAHEISDDGRYVVFTSAATNLVPEPNNAVQQVYVKDLVSGALVRASVANGTGVAGNRISSQPAISGDGHAVAFRSDATNLSPLATSGTSQVFVRDLALGTTSVESVTTAGALFAIRPSTAPSVSFDGRFVAFESEAPLDVRDLDNGTLDVFLRDRASGTTVLASLSNLAIAGAPSASASISGDGRYVGFFSLDDTLVPGDTNAVRDVFLYDRTTEALTLVSLNTAGQQASAASVAPSVSFDGHLVLFASTASNLVTSPPSTGNQLYVRDFAANRAPVLAAHDDVSLLEGQALRTTGSFTDPDASTAWNVTVNWGDASPTQSFVPNADKTFPLEHLYAPGSYVLTVEVTDNAGATGSATFHVTVANVAPTVDLPVSSVELAFDPTLDLSGTFTDPGSNETYTATVDYGDGSGVQPLALGPFDASPLAGGSFTLHHVYGAAGTYTVVLTVSDNNGGSGTGTLSVNVRMFTHEWLEPVSNEFVVGRNLPVKFTVHRPDGSFVRNESVRVEVLSASGAVVAGPYLFGDSPSRAVMVTDGVYHVNVDTRDLTAGLHTLRVSFSSPTLTGEFSLTTNGTGALRTGRR